ncbi:MAG TPA: nuclease-related domain-containing protein [Gammaproteobacteria bacterium]|nr:nuclease-related domain-containing protein [Gammaproteobacteria bacterium]
MFSDLTLSLPVLIAIAIGVVLLVTGVIWLICHYRSVYRRFDRVLRRIAADELRDIVIPDALDGHIHVDRLLLTEQGALVVEFKNVAGTVFAGERLDEWAVLDERGRHPFRNPLGGLQDRILAVRALAPELPVDGRIIFSDASEFPKGRPDKVCLLQELADRPRPADAGAFSTAWEALTQRVASAQKEVSPLPQGEG